MEQVRVQFQKSTFSKLEVTYLFPRCAPLNVPKLAEISLHGISEDGDEEVAPLLMLLLKFIQKRRNAVGQLGPVRVKTAPPTHAKPTEQPHLRTVG